MTEFRSPNPLDSISIWTFGVELPSGIEGPRISSLGLFECPAAPLHKLDLPYKLQGSVQVQADGYLMIQKWMEIDVPLPHNLGRCR